MYLSCLTPKCAHIHLTCIQFRCKRDGTDSCCNDCNKGWKWVAASLVFVSPSAIDLAIVRMDVNASTVSVSSLPPPLPPFPSSPPSSSPSHQENGPHLLDIAPIPFRLSSALRNCGVTANTCYRPLVEGEEVMVLGHAVYGSSASMHHASIMLIWQHDCVYLSFLQLCFLLFVSNSVLRFSLFSTSFLRYAL